MTRTKGPERSEEEWDLIIESSAAYQGGQWARADEFAGDLAVSAQMLNHQLRKRYDQGRIDRLEVHPGAVRYRRCGERWLRMGWGQIQPLRCGPVEWYRGEIA